MCAARERSSSIPTAPTLPRLRSYTVPSAPPLESALPRMDYGAAKRPTALDVSPSGVEDSASSPPEYNAVLANDPKARENASQYRTRQFMGSMASAGASVELIEYPHS